MIAKCGQLRVWHWAHKGVRTCDHWWERQTPWHRGWKDHFPEECQEIVQVSAQGEKHIADVKTHSGVVLEFQHSVLKQGERESREAFYKTMVWVVDARRRASDRERLLACVKSARTVSRTPHLISVALDACPLLRDWQASCVPVYFDFGDGRPDGTAGLRGAPMLWRVSPYRPNGLALLSLVPKEWFLDVHLRGLPFEEWHAKAERNVAFELSVIRPSPQSRPLSDFKRYLVRRERSRRRF
jgi:hypothetical protein